ncbi:MAG: SRPBCC family protein [Nocardioides sp.]
MNADPFDPAVALSDGRAELRIEQTWETDAADLWDAVSNPERLARWFAPIIGAVTVGGEFGIHFDDGDVPDMTLLSCDPGAFAFTWPTEAGSTEVRVEVLATGPTTSTLLLTHRLLPPASAPEYGAGWAAYVGQLRDHLDGRESGDWWSAFGASRDRLRERLAGLAGQSLA